jgi:hypothetical protein
VVVSRFVSHLDYEDLGVSQIVTIATRVTTV